MSGALRGPGVPRRAVLGALAAGAAGCTGRTLEYTMHSVYDDPTAPKGLPFQTGQILLSEAPGPYGILFTLAPDRVFRFTHSALIVTDAILAASKPRGSVRCSDDSPISICESRSRENT